MTSRAMVTRSERKQPPAAVRVWDGGAIIGFYGYERDFGACQMVWIRSQEGAVQGLCTDLLAWIEGNKSCETHP
ncbi:hypothetical protein SESBI_00950 [Sesbania bispinosa]|nr:hypothetical protein SESBI_00950 [Sesbania bispinosa]